MFNEMMAALGMKYETARELLIVALILSRSLPMIFLAPFMAGQQAPPEVKMSIGVLLAIVVWPLVRGAMVGPLPMNALPFLMLMLKETMVGFAIGFANSHVFSAMETAGRFIDTTRGAAMSEVLVPTSRQRATPIGTLYQQMMLCFFVAMNGHHIFIEAFFKSFETIPITAGIDATPGLAPNALFFTRITGDVMGIALILSAPAIAATFITDLVFGILNRVAPQLNAYFMAMPVKAMGGLALVLASLSPFIARLEYYVEQSLVVVNKTIELMAVRG